MEVIGDTTITDAYEGKEVILTIPDPLPKPDFTDVGKLCQDHAAYLAYHGRECVGTLASIGAAAIEAIYGKQFWDWQRETVITKVKEAAERHKEFERRRAENPTSFRPDTVPYDPTL